MRAILIVTYTLIVLFYSNCSPKTEPQPLYSVQVSVLVDITDKREVLPDAETLLSYYDLDKSKNTEAFFRLTTTTDKLFNPVAEIHLPSGDESEKDNQLDDPDFREKVVLDFYSNVRQSISSFNEKARKDTVIEHSECFRSIARELARMKENKTDKTLLVVYSDLAENSDLLNVYSKTDLELLMKHPNSVVKKFEATNLLPQNLYGYTVLFIFQPKNRAEDILFEKITTLYQNMLKARGAKVVIRSDNPKSI